MIVSVEQVSELHKLTGGNPFLVQYYGQEIQAGRTISDISNEILNSGHHYVRKLEDALDKSEAQQIHNLVNGKKLSNDRVNKLVDLEIIKKTDEGWEFNSLICKSHFSRLVQTGWGTKKWWQI